MTFYHLDGLDKTYHGTDTRDAHSFDDKVVNDSHIFNLNLCIQVTVQNKIIGQKIGIKFECENGCVKRNVDFFNSTESTECDNTSNLV